MLLFRYDVLILHADEDSKFADKMAQVLEQQRIKVCLKDRDLLGRWSYNILFKLKTSVSLTGRKTLDVLLSKFADKMAQVLEQQRIKVCLKDSDLLGS